MKAPEILAQAAQTLADRGKERDTKEGERSMGRAVDVFSEFIGRPVSEQEGWLFMIALKLARAERSNNPDHYIDLAGYCALLGEHMTESKPSVRSALSEYGASLARNMTEPQP